jgi:hypothetical protein
MSEIFYLVFVIKLDGSGTGRTTVETRIIHTQTQQHPERRV